MTIGNTVTTKHPFLLDPNIHTAIFGKTGTGKSVLMTRMILEDIREGKGVTVIDPHGGLVDEVLAQIPKHRMNDVIYLDPTLDRIVGINMFEATGHTSQIVSSLTRIIKNIWPENWGPRSEWLLENLSFALLSTAQPVSLLSVYKLLAENDFYKDRKNYRKRISAGLTEPALVKFFETYEHWTRSFREEVVTPLLNKVNKLALNPYLRVVIGQPTSSFQFREMMDSRKILLCSLRKGTIGDDVASLLGSLVVTKLSLAALSREQGEPLHRLYADEIQNFIHGVDFPTILSEARKYGLFLTVATQTLTQVPESARASIFGNCSTLISFRSSGEDAQILASEFSTRYQPQAFQDIPNYECFARSMSGRFPTETHRLATYPPGQGSPVRRDSIIKESLRRYGRPRDKVEARIRRHLLR